MCKHISVMTPCYNEEDNIFNLYNEVKQQFEKLPQYTYEHIFIDNFSSDKSRDILRDLAKKDKNVKVILNARNFWTESLRKLWDASGNRRCFDLHCM